MLFCYMMKHPSKKTSVFDYKSQEVVGFVNMQNWSMDASFKNLASHVLVFYVAGTNSSLKKNMGYFPTRNARADEIYPLFGKLCDYLKRPVASKSQHL